MGCCRKTTYRANTRSVLCLKWVTPIRLIALLSLAIHIGMAIFYKETHTIISTFTAFIHLMVVFLLLKECHISVKYHAFLKQKKNH